MQEYFDIINRCFFGDHNVKSETSTELKKIDQELVDLFERSLNLIFIPEEVNGNVCYASNSEFRADFRTTFQPVDLLDYLFAVVHQSQEPLLIASFMPPTNTTIFWQLVTLGSQIRKDI